MAASPHTPRPEGSGPVDRSSTAAPGRRLKRRWRKRVLTDEQLLEDRVEHLPAGPTCAGCRHMGEPVRVTDAHGARRLRRACPFRASGATDPAWPACEAYEGK
jgi:hypothetical protein